MVGDTPWNLISRSMTSEPVEESWDFDGSVLTSARNRTRRSPMLTRETSSVSGASVVGMTSGVCQRTALSAGWRPRNLHSAKSRRPALSKRPAAPAAGWRLDTLQTYL
jgi:hypothetical protein